MDFSRRVLFPTRTETENELHNGVFIRGVLSLELDSKAEEDQIIEISIVSNSQLLREGLPTLLSPHLKVQLVATYSGEYYSTTQFLNPPGHMVLLDSSVGISVVTKWIRRWRELFPPTHVFILELASDVELIVACIEAGASGYTLQGASTSEVAQAIKDALKGKAYSSPEVISRLFARVASLSATAKQLSTSPLTDRESEILQDVAAGLTNREIANHLVIELRTVKQHVHHILKKLNAHSRWEAVRLAAQHGWIGYHICLALALISPSILDAIMDCVRIVVCNMCEV